MRSLNKEPLINAFAKRTGCEVYSDYKENTIYFLKSFDLWDTEGDKMLSDLGLSYEQASLHSFINMTDLSIQFDAILISRSIRNNFGNMNKFVQSNVLLTRFNLP